MRSDYLERMIRDQCTCGGHHYNVSSVHVAVLHFQDVNVDLLGIACIMCMFVVLELLFHCVYCILNKETNLKEMHNIALHSNANVVDFRVDSISLS